jgi:hypothetical protein
MPAALPALYDARKRVAVSLPMPASPVEQPERRAKHDADVDAGDQRKIEGGAATLENDVAGEPTKPDP